MPLPFAIAPHSIVVVELRRTYESASQLPIAPATLACGPTPFAQPLINVEDALAMLMDELMRAQHLGAFVERFTNRPRNMEDAAAYWRQMHNVRRRECEENEGDILKLTLGYIGDLVACNVEKYMESFSRSAELFTSPLSLRRSSERVR